MPVIECACGMVMSIPANGRRICCIRCGGVELHFLDRTEASRSQVVPDFQLKRSRGGHGHQEGTARLGGSGGNPAGPGAGHAKRLWTIFELTG